MQASSSSISSDTTQNTTSSSIIQNTPNNQSNICNTNNIPNILSLHDPDHPPILSKVQKRALLLSPTVALGLEREAKISDFTRLREIGKGGFGKVASFRHIETGKVYCIKIVQKRNVFDKKLVKQMNKEIEIMYLINHPHCLKLVNHFEDDDNFYLVMPLAQKGQLYRILKKFTNFDERTTAQILRETISALKYLHSFNPPIIHRDIKPENILLNENGRVLLADYGWSTFDDGGVRRTFCGTPEYIAPEMLMKLGHDHRVDIWSIGVLMFELLAGYSPFVSKENHQQVYENIKKLRIKWPKDMSPMAKNLIGEILKINPSERPSLDSILSHEWFKNTKEIKPLLENELKTTKDILLFHMISKFNDETIKRLNGILGIKNCDLDNKSNDKDNNNIINNNNDADINISDEKLREILKANPTSNIKLNDKSGMSNPENYNNKIVSLQKENQEIRKTTEILKRKLAQFENDIKNITKENEELSKQNTSALLSTLSEKEKEIESLKKAVGERVELLAETEEKNKEKLEFTREIAKLNGICDEKDKEIEKLREKNKELKDKFNIKEMTVFSMKKENRELEMENEKLIAEYQIKMDELELKLFNKATNVSNPRDALKIIDLLNDNISDNKINFSNKIENLSDNFSSYKRAFQQSNNTLTTLINNNNKFNVDQINKFNKGLINDVNSTFSSVEKSLNSAIERRIDLLSKRVNELKKQGNKIIDSKKIEQTQKECEETNKKIKNIENEIQILQKKYDDEKLNCNNLENDIKKYNKKYDDIVSFMQKNMPNIYKEYEENKDLNKF